MIDKIFVDTNIWLYAFMEQDIEKSRIARKIINSNSKYILSVQVINEICVNLIKKAFYTEEEIQQPIKNLNDVYEISSLKIEDILLASQIRTKYSFSYWDSLIVSSALNNKCNILYSEDMHHNLMVEGKLKIINPFINDY
ncbi:PIN domain-containing protein [Persephonella sp.]|uniref:PIN domain-containing protein n=1 Tax=Persephonella sp. TaxID=2060922 RepID=UPI002628887B|nr:PIN domain-containing protein [Persephonella sp.]